MDAYRAEGWADFAVAVAGAGAALAGLLFVALSINLERILSGSRLPARAAHTLVLLAAPLVVALVLLVPGQSGRALGVELVTVGAATGLLLAALNHPGRRASQQPLIWWLIAEALPAVALSGTTIVAGAGLLTTSLSGLYWLVAGVVVAFVGALLNAWVLLVEILR
ncbi:modulator of FtsH protease [Saccharomonospora amisosensis]|uniref:Modulator of FtsH protease n=1 Tax=Saccharomonospora amisosensis TaxID=1128677 RepID=A0A7X5UQP6_9PSEU|nr:hypothetical protein [Saccharomonospora amisosensis]NIJ12456.1 modulator of FtsH protease [Saccharomonospora amisosensis]